MLPGKLKVGDTVVVLGGGNSQKGKTLKGSTGEILSFNKKNERVTVKDLNMVRRHTRAKSNAESSGIVDKEGSIHVSNVAYYVEELGKGVKLRGKILEDGSKVRGYIHPESGNFEQLSN